MQVDFLKCDLISMNEFTTEHILKLFRSFYFSGMVSAPSHSATLLVRYEIPYDLDAAPLEVESLGTKFSGPPPTSPSNDVRSIVSTL
jgi:hypothetical protein